MWQNVRYRYLLEGILFFAVTELMLVVVHWGLH